MLMCWNGFSPTSIVVVEYNILYGVFFLQFIVGFQSIIKKLYRIKRVQMKCTAMDGNKFHDSIRLWF